VRVRWKWVGWDARVSVASACYDLGGGGDAG